MNEKTIAALQTMALAEAVREAFRLAGRDGLHPFRIAVVCEGTLETGQAVTGLLSVSIPGVHMPIPDTAQLLMEGVQLAWQSQAGAGDPEGPDDEEES